jgi:hypothetical protein
MMDTPATILNKEVLILIICPPAKAMVVLSWAGKAMKWLHHRGTILILLTNNNMVAIPSSVSKEKVNVVTRAGKTETRQPRIPTKGELALQPIHRVDLAQIMDAPIKAEATIISGNLLRKASPTFHNLNMVVIKTQMLKRSPILQNRIKSHNIKLLLIISSSMPLTHTALQCNILHTFSPIPSSIPSSGCLRTCTILNTLAKLLTCILT